jgi:hypothetical protein
MTCHFCVGCHVSINSDIMPKCEKYDYRYDYICISNGHLLLPWL